MSITITEQARRSGLVWGYVDDLPLAVQAAIGWSVTLMWIPPPRGGAGSFAARQWVFPATRVYRDRRTGQRGRHHLHKSMLQRAVKAAVHGAGLAKRASPHPLRHSFATHLLEDG